MRCAFRDRVGRNTLQIAERLDPFQSLEPLSGLTFVLSCQVGGVGYVQDRMACAYFEGQGLVLSQRWRQVFASWRSSRSMVCAYFTGNGLVFSQRRGRGSSIRRSAARCVNNASA